MNNKKITAQKASLDELVFGALSQLQTLNYNGRSIRRYQAIWNRLIKFAKQHDFEDKLTEKLIVKFLEHYNLQPEELIKARTGWQKHAEFSLKILWRFARYGCFERTRTLIQKLNIPPTMNKVLYDYVGYCKNKCCISECCCNERIRQIGLLLDFVRKYDVKTFEQIRATHLSDFVCSLWGFSKKTISRIVSDIRQFLKYLFLRELITQDISKTLPTVHVSQYSKIPSVWDRALVEKLLSVVNRRSPKGKRDYAILLLACRLGLRNGEIRDLTLDQINWETETIAIIQSKTQNSLVLPLTDEIGNALIDYIKFARPATNYRQVFLRLKPPHIPFGEETSLYHVVKYWKDLAGIKFRTKQHEGTHSLRHSLATYLLEEGTSFPVISNILGHTSSSSTMIYAKSSVEMLRQVALSLEEVDHGN